MRSKWPNGVTSCEEGVPDLEGEGEDDYED